MTAASLLRDLAAFSMQVALVTLGLAVLLKIVRIPAGTRYVGLRLALLASLITPWLLRTPAVQAPVLIMSGTPAPAAVPIAPASVATPAVPRSARPPATSTPDVPWMQIGFGALFVGIVARVVWLGMGVLRLLRLTRGGVVVDVPEYSMLQQQLGTRATIAQVSELPQPATFGVRHPIVLLPDALATAPLSLRRAVVAHELFHVRRRDWLALLGEETVRTLLWFHPAIHWLTAQVQLAREEIVDELAVRATGDRRTYVEALLAFADTPGLAPAPAFAHRRQLFHRILSVSKEKAMSTPRIVSSAAVLIAVATGASWYASTLFPIVKAAKIERLRSFVNAQTPLSNDLAVRAATAAVMPDQQRGEVRVPRAVTPENPIPRRTRGVAPVPPSQYGNAQVTVSARVTVDRNGTVTAVDPDSCVATVGRTDATICAAFQNAAGAAVRQWKYERPAQAPIEFYVRIGFRPAESPTIAQSGESYHHQTRNTYLEQAQDALRTVAEQAARGDRVATDDLRKAQLAELAAQYRELERAQRLALDRGPNNPELIRLQQEMARLNDELGRAEAQIRSARSPQANEQLRAAAEASTERLRQAQRALEESRAQRTVEDQARAEEERRALAEQLRVAQANLDAVRARMEQAAASRPLVSPSGRPAVRVGDVPGMNPPTVRKSVKPEHPLIAQSARVQGTVILEVLVDEQGRVADVRVTRSIPLLDQAAMDAARQWEFTPTLVNGVPVPVLLQLEMNFTLK